MKKGIKVINELLDVLAAVALEPVLEDEIWRNFRF